MATSTRKSLLPTFSVLDLCLGVGLCAVLFAILRTVPGGAVWALVLGVALVYAVVPGAAVVGISWLRDRRRERARPRVPLFCVVVLATLFLELVLGGSIGLVAATLPNPVLDRVAEFVLRWIPLTPIQRLVPPNVPALLGVVIGMEFGTLLGLLIAAEVALHAPNRNTSRDSGDPSSESTDRSGSVRQLAFSSPPPYADRK